MIGSLHVALFRYRPKDTDLLLLGAEKCSRRKKPLLRSIACFAYILLPRKSVFVGAWLGCRDLPCDANPPFGVGHQEG